MGAGYQPRVATRDGLNRAIQASPPHLHAILEAVRDRHIRFGHVAQHKGAFAFPPGLPIVLLLGDDYDLAWGPQAFDRPSLARFLRGASSAAIVAGAPARTPYDLAVAGAILSGRDALIVETVERWEADWVSLLREMAPGLPTLVSTPGPKGARH